MFLRPAAGWAPVRLPVDRALSNLLCRSLTATAPQPASEMKTGGSFDALIVTRSRRETVSRTRNRRPEVGRMPRHRVDHNLRKLTLSLIPAPPARQPAPWRAGHVTFPPSGLPRSCPSVMTVITCSMVQLPVCTTSSRRSVAFSRLILL